IPGASDKFNTEDAIQKLMAVKKIPITEKELNIKDIEIENSIIRDFSQYLRNLDSKSKSLYDYQSPFREMKGYSDDSK
ncbi:MAG: hypothetical protein N2485_08635, partial [bacterium]|nr:hypothetical protein [bacterium]